MRHSAAADEVLCLDQEFELIGDFAGENSTPPRPVGLVQEVTDDAATALARVP
jgi:hypothetical protein